MDFSIDTDLLKETISGMKKELENANNAMSNAFTTLKNLPAVGAWGGSAYSMFWSKCVERKSAFITYLNFIGTFINDLDLVLNACFDCDVEGAIRKACKGISPSGEVALSSGPSPEYYEYSQDEQATDNEHTENSKTTESYNQGQMESAISQITAFFNDFCDCNKALKEIVENKIAVQDSALYGMGASSMKSAWDNHIKGMTNLEEGIAAITFNMNMALNNAAVTDQEIADAFGTIKVTYDGGESK